MTTKEEKQALRRRIKGETAALTPPEKARQAAEVFARVEALPEFAAAHTIAAYWSLPDELPTAAALARWAAAGKQIALPVVEGDTMTFRLYTPPEESPYGNGSASVPKDEDGAESKNALGESAAGESAAPAPGLVSGAFGIGEPTGGKPVPPGKIDLLIVPGVAFDAQGFRLGRGKGFYDRFLAACTGQAAPYTVGVCLMHQRVERVPCEPHDRRIDCVITSE